MIPNEKDLRLLQDSLNGSVLIVDEYGNRHVSPDCHEIWSRLANLNDKEE